MDEDGIEHNHWVVDSNHFYEDEISALRAANELNLDVDCTHFYGVVEITVGPSMDRIRATTKDLIHG